MALNRFNKIMRIFFLASPITDHNGIILNTLRKLGCSQRFESFLDSRVTVKDAVISYKTEIVKKLNRDFQRAQELVLADEAFDKALLSCYLPKIIPQISDAVAISASTKLEKAALTNEESPDNRKVRINKRSCLTLSPAHGIPSPKKRKIRHEGIFSEYKNECSSHEHGDCRRGSSCRYGHRNRKAMS